MKKIKTILSVIAMLIISATFIACVPNNASDARKKMKEEGYTVEKMSTEDFSSIFDGVDLGLISITACANKTDALIIYAMEDEECAEHFGWLFERMANSELTMGLEGELIIKSAGKIVYMGTEGAFEDLEA